MKQMKPSMRAGKLDDDDPTIFLFPSIHVMFHPSVTSQNGKVRMYDIDIGIALGRWFIDLTLHFSPWW
jgi:hypothetical protein